MTGREAEDLKAAMADLRATDGVFYLGLVKRVGDTLWRASVAHDEVEKDSIVHASDPAVFEAAHADPASALRIAVEKAVTAMREPPRIG